MTKNINFDASNDDDAEGHVMRFGEAPSLRIADETPSMKVFGDAPGAADDDDTEGHVMRFDEAPGITGSISVDPKAHS